METISKRSVLRGLGGRGGSRSMITERGGMGTGGNFRMTRVRMRET